MASGFQDNGRRRRMGRKVGDGNGKNSDSKMLKLSPDLQQSPV